MKKTDNNKRFEELLAERNLEVTYFIRYVYVLENNNNEFLLIKRISQSVGELYLGWQLMADTLWGCDWNDIDIMQMPQEAIKDLTQLKIHQKDVVLSNLFVANNEDHEILNVVYNVRINDLTDFKYWYDNDDEIQWSTKETALNILAYEEDKKIVDAYTKGVKSLL